jgi:hypothetical protein
MELGTSARGRTSPDEAWERYARPALWPGWAPQIRAVEGPDRLAAGERGRVHGLLGVEADFVVDSWDDHTRTWSWTVVGRLPYGVRGPTLHLVHGVEPAGAGSRAWLRVRGPSPWVVAYLGPARLALHRLVS